MPNKVTGWYILCQSGFLCSARLRFQNTHSSAGLARLGSASSQTDPIIGQMLTASTRPPSQRGGGCIRSACSCPGLICNPPLPPARSSPVRHGPVYREDDADSGARLKEPLLIAAADTQSRRPGITFRLQAGPGRAEPGYSH